MRLGREKLVYYGILRQPYVFLNASSRKLSLSSKLCKQYVGINYNYNNYVTAATFTLSYLPPGLHHQVTVLNDGRGTEGETS